MLLSESLKKKVARLLVYVMLTTDVAPAMAMQQMENPAYRITVTREESTLQNAIPLFRVEAQRLTQQMVEGVMTAVYQTICTQVIMMTMIATVMETVQKISEIVTSQKLPEISEENQIGFDEIEEKPGNFVDIEGVGRVRIDENGSVILDNTAPLDAGKKIAIKTERNIIVDSLKCEGLIADAPSVVIKGESEIKSIDVSVAKNFVIAEGASLNFENAKINGRVANYGILNFRLPNSKILMNGGNFWNYGTMSGRGIGMENFGSLRNFGKIDGENLNFQGNALKNSGTIGS